MRIPQLNQLEISLPDRDELSRNVQNNSSHASLTSELSVDLFTKERSEEDDCTGQDSLSSSCRWDPDDSDFSLNILLPPTREESPESRVHGNGTGGGSQVNDVSSTKAPSNAKDSILGADYSLNKLRSRSSKKIVLESSYSSSSTLETEYSASEASTKRVPANIEVSKPAPPTASKTKREPMISFYPRVRIQRIAPRKHLSKEHIGAVWYSRDEFQTIRQECFQTLKLMGDDGDEPSDVDQPLFDEETNVELCRRGLEYKTPTAYKHRQKQKKEIRTVVLEEQDFQEEADMDDPEWLAKLSRDQSRSCVRNALLVAARDAHVARMYYQEEGLC